MRTPKLEIDLKPLIDKKIIDARTEKQKQILSFVLDKKKLVKGFKESLLTISYETIANRTEQVLTFRYNGIFLFREITIDKQKLHFKYLTAETQTN